MGRKTVYNKNLFTPEKWECVNEENKELMEEFLGHLQAIGRSQGTLKQYRNDLRIFFTWMLKKCKNKHFTEIKKREISNFQGYLLNECGMSGARIARLRSAVSSMGNFIENIMDDEYEDFRNNVGKIEAPAKVAVREKTILKFDECCTVADELLEDGKIMLSALLMVACYSGLRQQELTRLLIQDFTTNVNMALGGNFYKTSKIKVKGRGDRREEKYVWNKCDKWLKHWLEHRNSKNIDSEYLFCKTDGTKLEESSMASMAQTLSRYFEKPMYWHSLRHALVTELSRAGLPLDVSKMLLGHSNVAVTAIYNDITDDENMEQYADFFSGNIEKVEKKGLGDL